MIEYNWNITKLITTGENNTVTEIHWELTGTEGDLTTPRVYRHVVLPDPEESNFIAYENISKDTALTWLFSVMPEEQKEFWETTCDINLQKMKRASVADVPWSN